MRGRRTLLIGLIVAIAGGCTDSLSPADYVGEYALVRVDGDALPAFLYANSGIFSASILADTIRLRGDGTGSRTSAIFYEFGSAPAGQTADALSVSTRELTYTTTGGVIEASYDCPPNAGCVPPPHFIAVRTGAGLKVTREENMRVPLEFLEISR